MERTGAVVNALAGIVAAVLIGLGVAVLVAGDNPAQGWVECVATADGSDASLAQCDRQYPGQGAGVRYGTAGK